MEVVVVRRWDWRSALIPMAGCPGLSKAKQEFLWFCPASLQDGEYCGLAFNRCVAWGQCFLFQGECTLPSATECWGELAHPRCSLTQEITMDSSSRWLTVWKEWLYSWSVSSVEESGFVAAFLEHEGTSWNLFAVILLTAWIILMQIARKWITQKPIRMSLLRGGTCKLGNEHLQTSALYRHPLTDHCTHLHTLLPLETGAAAQHVGSAGEAQYSPVLQLGDCNPSQHGPSNVGPCAPPHSLTCRGLSSQGWRRFFPLLGAAASAFFPCNFTHRGWSPPLHFLSWLAAFSFSKCFSNGFMKSCFWLFPAAGFGCAVTEGLAEVSESPAPVCP